MDKPVVVIMGGGWLDPIKKAAELAAAFPQLQNDDPTIHANPGKAANVIHCCQCDGLGTFRRFIEGYVCTECHKKGRWERGES